MPHTNCIENGSAPVAAEWFAFRVRPKHEKSVALHLRDKRQECFVPLVRHPRKWANRLSHVDLPLFSGYVFCRSHRFGFLPILQTPGVVDVIRAGNAPAPIPAEEIQSLERAIRASVPLENFPYCEVGEKVQIRSGPLAGVTGTVNELRKAGCLILSITLLRRSVLAQVDESQLCEYGPPGSLPQRHQVA